MIQLRVRSFIPAVALMAFLTTAVLAGGGGPGSVTSVTVQSGVSKMVAYQYSMSTGVNLPVTVTLAVKPKNGTVTIRKTANRTEIFYQSKKGFVGEDSFQFNRPTQDKWGGIYTIAVTVK